MSTIQVNKRRNTLLPTISHKEDQLNQNNNLNRSDELDKNNHHVGVVTPGNGGTSAKSKVVNTIGLVGKVSGSVIKRITKGLNPMNIKTVIVGEDKVDQSKLKPRTNEFI
jgi:hypothetical protein